MVNPFTHTAKVVSAAYSSASGSDCCPGLCQLATTVGMPIVIPFAFVHAFFKRAE